MLVTVSGRSTLNACHRQPDRRSTLKGCHCQPSKLKLVTVEWPLNTQNLSSAARPLKAQSLSLAAATQRLLVTGGCSILLAAL
mmetsp:Transcript_7524/g.17207  ORF Transcript_7524/g.17207 Transcript_7524/m.17207 type:complete len:83 (+) Transcript_7524:266-514(+)